MTPPVWSVERWVGSAAELHAWEPPPDERIVRWSDVTKPALVLGSGQRSTTIDEDACAEQGIQVVRRRSGGGAVLIWPGELVWLDVVIPAADPLWDDDVGRSMWWLGEVWARALGACGVEAATVHRGPLLASDWSSTVCFAGLGPGEVLVGGSKAVGISQRRTRRWARLQAALHTRWRHDVVASLVVGERPASEMPMPFCVDPGLVDRLRVEIEHQLSDR